MPSDKQQQNEKRQPRRSAPPSCRESEWTDREKAWLKFGVSLAVLGCVGAVAPLFGLQFRKLKDGNMQVPVSIGLIVLGGIIDLVVFLRHGGLGSVDLSQQTKRRILYGLGGAALLTMLACGGLVVLAKIRDNRFAAPPAPERPVGPGVPANVGRPPPNAPARPVRITLKNIKDLDLVPLKAKLETLSARPEIPVGMPPFFGGDELPVLLYYADSLESLVDKISFGKAEVSNVQARQITVVVDRSQFTERSKGKR